MTTKDPHYNIASIRDLLTAVFDGPRLQRFCHDRELFAPILKELAVKGSVTDWIETVIGYCERHDLLAELQTAVQEEQRRPPVPPLGAIHQAPRPLADFVGRQKEIRQLLKALQPGGRAAITGIVGMGGLGKTELAKMAAREVAGRFPDGVLWADCGQQELTAVADLWAAAYEVQLAGDDLPSKAAAWRGLVSGKQALLIFDNVQPEQAVGELFPPVGQSAVLVTSRDTDHPALHGASRLKLDQFTLAEAIALVRKVLGKKAAGEQAAEAEQLFGLLGYLPLAVAVALQSARECGWGLRYLNEKLAAAGVLQLLGDEKLLGQSLRATFETAWESLAEELQDTFRTLALFNEGPSFSTAALAETLDLAGPEARARLRRLARRSLLTDMGDGRWALHPLLRQFAVMRPAVDEVVRARMAHHYALVAGAANALYQLGGEKVMLGLALFDLEWRHIRAGQAWAAAHADDDKEAARLCSDYAGYAINCLELRLHPMERIRWLEAGARAAHLAGDKRAEGTHLGSLGSAYAAMGDARRAIGFYEQWLEIARETGDRRGEGAALSNLGIAYKNLGEARRAIGYHEQALEIARKIGDRRGEGNDLGSLGLTYAALGEARRAIGCYEQALAIYRDIGDRRGEGRTLSNLGLAYVRLGDVRRAIGCYEHCLSIHREIGDRQGEGAALGNLGVAHRQMGDVRRAIDYYEEQLVITREIGDRRGEGNALGNLGVAYKKLGEARRAIGYYEEQLVITREIGDRRGEGNALSNLGSAYAGLGEAHRAIGDHEQTLAIYREIGDRRGEGIALGNLGSAYEALGEARRAIGFYEQWLEIARETGDRRGEGNALGSLGAAYRQIGEVVRTRELWTQALGIYEAIEDPNAEQVRGWLADLDEEAS